jgi:hypothetical protein
MLTQERTQEVNQQGKAAWEDYVFGHVVLVQRRVSVKACEYQAISTKMPISEPATESSPSPRKTMKHVDKRQETTNR